MIWIPVRDVHGEHARPAADGVPVVREPAVESWGLIEMHIEDPDGVRIVLAEVPAGHPVRRDPRPATGVTSGTANRLPHKSAFTETWQPSACPVGGR
jgi:Glyoxalase/Bleomycin resistance protein/Dioxygenase superfamily